MRLTLAQTEGLNAVSCDRLLARLTEARARNAPQITVDLANAAFIDPYGAACLALVVKHLAGRGQQVICVLPNDGRTQQTAWRIGLVAILRSVAELRNLTVQEPSSGEHPSTLALSAIRSRSDVQEVLAYLVGLAQRRLGYEAGDVLDATKVVSELCYNVVDHSAAEGLVTAHIAQDRQGRRYIALAVVDAGLGIRASLAHRYPEAAAWRHGQAIERALSGLSSRQAGGGMGLRSVQAIVQRYGGRLSLRSGDDRFFLLAGRQPRIMPGAPFPGTQVGISFSQRN